MAGIFGDESAVDAIFSGGDVGEWRLWAYQLLYPSSMPEVENGTLQHDDEALREKLTREFRVAYQNHVTSLRRENDALRDQMVEIAERGTEGNRAILEMREIYAALAGADTLSAEQKLAVIADVRRRTKSMTAEEVAKRSKPDPFDYRASQKFSPAPTMPYPGGSIFDGLPSDHGDLDRQLTIAEAAAGVGVPHPEASELVAIGVLLQVAEPHYKNGDAADIIAKEFLSSLDNIGGKGFLEMVRGQLSAIPKTLVLHAAADHQVFGSEKGLQWLSDLFDALSVAASDADSP